MDDPLAYSAETAGDLTRIADAFADPDEVRRVQQGYLRFFEGARRVLDLGCGRGIFLDLLREEGIESVGIDASEERVTECRAHGHDVIHDELLERLSGYAETRERFDGAFLSHVVEHFPPASVSTLLREVTKLLEPDGRVVVVTPNVTNLIVITELFWLDPTHVRPYPRALLEALGADAGLTVVESFDDPATVPRRAFPLRLLARARSALSGADRSSPLDSVVVLARA